MARHNDLHTSIFDNADFRAMSTEAQYAYIWGFGNSRCGMSGLYSLAPGTLTFEIGLGQDAELSVFDELEERRFAYYRNGFFWIRTRVKHLRTRTPQIAKSILSDLDLVPADNELRSMFVDEYRDSWLTKMIEKHSLEQALFVNVTDRRGGSMAMATAPAMAVGTAHQGEREENAEALLGEPQRDWLAVE